MSVLAATSTSQRHVTGDLVVRFYSLSGTNGDTFAPPQQQVLMVVPIPTTAIAIGYTLASDVITFVTSGAWAAKVMVISRVG